MMKQRAETHLKEVKVFASIEMFAEINMNNFQFI